MRPHTLDANALYRFLTNGPGAETVEQIFVQCGKAKLTVRMSAINWAETMYVLGRSYKLAEVRLMLAQASNRLDIVNVDRVLAEEAAVLKMRTGLGIADCLAAVTAGPAGVLVTADREFEKVPGLRILALPRHRQ